MNAEWTDAAVGPRYRATMQRRADAPPSLFDGASCKESIEKSHDAAAIATWQQDLPWLLDPELSSEEELCDISSSSSSSSSRSPPSCRAASAGGGGGAGECTLTVKRYLSNLAQAHLQRSLPPSRPPVSGREELQGCRPSAVPSAAAATILTTPPSCTPSRLPHAHAVRPRCNAAAAAASNPPAAAAAAAALARLPVAERLQLVVAEVPVSVHSP